MSELTLDVGQANELKLAFRREGPWTNEEIKMLTERKGFLRQVREALLGRAEIKVLEHMIDLDSAPFIPDGWSVEEHQKGGVVKWDATKIALHLDESQTKGDWIDDSKLRKNVAKLSPYNANMLDFLIKKENQHLIPEEWKGRYIFFWGTIYRRFGRGLYVRYLNWSGGRWLWDYHLLSGGWNSDDRALVPASQD